MRDQTVVSRYAKAYVSIVSKAAKPEGVFEELKILINGVFSQKQVVDYFANPSVSIKEKNTAIKKVLSELKLESVNRKFIQLIIKNNRFSSLQYMVPTIKKTLLDALGMVEVTLTVPSEPDDALKKKFIEAFEKKTGKKVLLDIHVDTAILGGAVAQIGSLLIDGSLKNRLVKIKEKLSEEI